MVEPAPARSTRARGAAVATVLAALAALAGIGVFAWFRIWQARVGDPLIWQDSLQYQSLGNQRLLSHWLWAGDRPPVTPLFWKLSGNATTFVFLQTLVSILAWSALAVAVARLVRPRWGQRFGGAAVLGFAATRPVTQWDRSVLSESLSLSVLALLFTVVILWAVRPTVWRSVAVVGVALVFAALRDTQIWVIVLFAVAFGAYAAWRALRVDTASARPALVVASGLVLVVAVTAASSMASHRDVKNVQDALYARVFPYPSRIAWFADHGMPQARRLTALARSTSTTHGDAPVVSIDLADPKFQPLAGWLRSDAPRTYVEWLLLHPGTVLKEPLLRPERTYNNADGHLSFYAASDRSDAPVLTTLLYPAWGWVAAAAIVAAGIVARLGQTRRLAWLVVVLLGALGLFHMLVAWHGDGMEVTRHASVGNVQVRLGVLILLVMLLDGRRPASDDQDDQPDVSINPK
jgi:hypothetical protein